MKADSAREAHPSRVRQQHGDGRNWYAHAMKIQEITTAELRRMLADTERLLGSRAVEVRLLRRELTRRDQGRQKARPQTGDKTE